MFNQIIEIIKSTTITTIGLIVGLFGVDNTDFLQATDINLQTAQEQAIDLSEFSQASILEAVSGEAEDIITQDTTIPTEETQVVSTGEIQTTETVSDTTITQDGTEYFIKEDIPSAIFTRPESLITKTETSEELITLGEGASEDTRAINPIKSTITKKEVDVTKILNTDFDKFDSKLQITEITEDDDNFYVSYQYLTLAVENRVWGETIKEKNISIAKNILDGKDLSEYLSEELAEVIDTEIVYLKEVQEIQKIKKAKADQLAQAETKKRTVASAYSSLIGKVLQVEESEFGGFEPIVKKEVTETTAISDIVIGGETTTATITATTTEAIATTTPVENNVTSTGVVDNQAPLIVIQGNNPALIQIGSSYVDLGAKVSDNISEGLGVNVGGDVVDTETKGSYFVVYTATDEAGNIATATREVIVYDYGLAPDVEQVVDTTSTETEETTTPTTTTPVISEEETITTPIEAEEATTTPEEEIATTTPEVETGIIKTIVETTTNVIDASAEVVQETIDTAVKATTEAIDTSAEIVQETVDIAVEVTTEVVGDSVDAVVETTTDVAEQVTAMILSINIRDLLGNIGVAGEGQITRAFTDGLDKSGEVVFRNINKIVNKVKEFMSNLIDLSPFVLTETSSPVFKGVINTAQILSSGVYDIIGNMADGSYSAFNFIWKKIKSFSEDNISEVEENVGSINESVLDTNLYEDTSSNTFVRFVSFSFNETKKVVSNVFKKISGSSSMASIKYSNQEFVLEEMQENDVSRIEIFKNKISDFSNIVKDGFSKTKKFLEETTPNIGFEEK